MSTIDEDNVLQNLMNTILFVAMEDGEITEDELAILHQVKLDITVLRTAIQNAEKDINISGNEAENLKEFRKNLLKNAYNISQKDKIITKDERKIINCLIRSLMNN